MIPAGFCALPLPITQLSLAVVLKCGQSFRWSVFPLSAESSSVGQNEYRLCLHDRVVCLRQSPDTLFYRSVFPNAPSTPALEAETLAFINDYFQLDIDLINLYKQWADADPVFKRVQSRFSGIRILRQDPWENLISFICSSNNNISRITKMVASLCKQFSPPLLSFPDPSVSSEEHGDRTYHPFPHPSALAAPEVSSTLRSLGFGYRAEFIQKTAKMLVDAHGYVVDPLDQSESSEKWLKTLRFVGTIEAREELLKLVGVGRKVADCVLLMSLDKKEVVPVDTHVCQIAIKHYGLCGPTGAKPTMTPKLYDKVNEKLAGVWGEYAGWAHSVLFTSDLKSFSSLGLSSSITPKKRTPRTAPLLSENSVLSHKAVPEVRKADDNLHDNNSSSLVDRVKGRRRIVP